MLNSAFRASMRRNLPARNVLKAFQARFTMIPARLAMTDGASHPGIAVEFVTLIGKC